MAAIRYGSADASIQGCHRSVQTNSGSRKRCRSGQSGRRKSCSSGSKIDGSTQPYEQAYTGMRRSREGHGNASSGDVSLVWGRD